MLSKFVTKCVWALVALLILEAEWLRLERERKAKGEGDVAA